TNDGGKTTDYHRWHRPLWLHTPVSPAGHASQRGLVVNIQRGFPDSAMVVSLLEALSLPLFGARSASSEFLPQTVRSIPLLGALFARFQPAREATDGCRRTSRSHRACS